MSLHGVLTLEIYEDQFVCFIFTTSVRRAEASSESDAVNLKASLEPHSLVF